MRQLTITDFPGAVGTPAPPAPAPKPRARRADPETSHEAARCAAGTAAAHRDRILEALQEHTEGGTKDELAVWTGLDSVAVARPMKELERAGAVCRGGKRPLRTGARGVVWRAA